MATVVTRDFQPRVRRPERAALLRLLGYVLRRERRAFAEEEVLHVLRDEVLRLFLPRHQAVLVENHLHPVFPHLPGLRGDICVDTLAQFARPRWFVEARELFLELHAEDLAPADIANGFGRNGIAGVSHFWIVASATRDRSQTAAVHGHRAG